MSFFYCRFFFFFLKTDTKYRAKSKKEQRAGIVTDTNEMNIFNIFSHDVSNFVHFKLKWLPFSHQPCTVFKDWKIFIDVNIRSFCPLAIEWYMQYAYIYPFDMWYPDIRIT